MDIIDRARLEEFNRYDRSGSLLNSVLDIFMHVSPRTIADLQRAAECEDTAGLLRAVHALKSSAAHAGATRLSAYCREFEQRFEAYGRVSDGVRDEVSRIVEEHGLVMECLREIRRGSLNAADGGDLRVQKSEISRALRVESRSMDWILFLLFLTPAGAHAAVSPCEAEAPRICGPNGGLMCLFEHRKDLSPSCLKELDRLVAAKREASMRGGGALTSFGGMNAIGPPVSMISLSGTWVPNAGDGSRQIENRAELSSPIYRRNSGTLAGSLAGGNVALGEDYELSSGVVAPHQLTRLESGLQYGEGLSGNRNWMVRASAGYSGDQFSQFGRDASYSVMAAYGYPSHNPKGYWEYFIFAANNSQIVNYVPIPGFIYIYRTEKFTGYFGFPIMSMQWTPVDKLALSFSLFGYIAQAEASYGTLSGVQGFMNWSYTQQSFILAARTDVRDRFFLHVEKFGPGLRFLVGDRVMFEAQGGITFEREMHIGHSVLSVDEGSAFPPAEIFANLGLKIAL